MLASDIIISCKSCCLLKLQLDILVTHSQIQQRGMFLKIISGSKRQSTIAKAVSPLLYQALSPLAVAMLSLRSIVFCYDSIHFVLSRSFGRFALLMLGCHRSAFGGSLK